MKHSEKIPEISVDMPISSEFGLLDLALIVALNLRLLLIGPFFSGLIALIVSFALPPQFTASASFMPVLVYSQDSTAKNTADQYLALLNSRSVLEGIVTRFDLVKQFSQKDRQQAISLLQKRVNIKASRDGLVTVTVDNANPKLAAALANAYVQELTKTLSRISLTESQQRRKFFEGQVALVNERLSTAQLEWRSKRLNADWSKSSSAIAVERLARLDANIAAKEIKLSSMRSYLAESSVDYSLAQADLRTLRSQRLLQEVVPTVLVGDTGTLNHYRKLKYEEILLDLLSWQYEIARVDELRDDVPLRVVDTASAPENPDKPHRLQIVLICSTLTGVALIFFVFVRHALRQSGIESDSGKKFRLIYDALRIALGLKSA